MLINPLAIGLLKESVESVASQIAMWDETGTDQQGVPVHRQGSAGGRNAPPEGGDLFRLDELRQEGSIDSLWRAWLVPNSQPPLQPPGPDT